MRYYTHAAIGGFAGYLLSRFTGNPYIPSIVAAAVGSLVPDLDHPDAYISRRIPLWRPFVSVVQMAFPKNKIIAHRGILHSIYGLMLFSSLSIIVVFLLSPTYWYVAVAFSLGYISHLYMADIFNESGVHLFRLSKSIRIPKNGRHIKVGGPGEISMLSIAITIPIIMHFTKGLKPNISGDALFTNLPLIIIPLSIATLVSLALIRYRYRSRRIRNCVTFSVELPRDDQSDLEVATHLFNTLHGIRYPWYRRIHAPQPHITLEIHGSDDVVFFVSVPNERELPRRVKSIFQSLYPNIMFNEEKHLKIDIDKSSAVCQIKQLRNSVFPIRSYLFDEETADPMSALTNALSGCPPGETRTIQILVKPTGNSWQHKARRVRNRVREKSNLNVSTIPILWIISDILEMLIGVISDIFLPSDGKSSDANDPRITMSSAMLPDEIKEFDEAADRKLQRNCFRTEIRLVVQSDNAGYHDVEALTDAFGIYKGLNTLKRNRVWFYNRWLFLRFSRDMFYPVFGSRTIMDSEELGSIYHPPGLQVETRGLRRTYQRSKETVVGIPSEGVFMGYSVDRDGGRVVALDHLSEGGHICGFGRTGVGKSELIKNLINEGLKDGGGLFLDPHGDAAKDLCGQIDPDYCHKVFYWAPWSENVAIGFNVLEKSDNPSLNELNLIAGQTIDVFHSSWQMKDEFVRLKHYLRYGLMTLLQYPGPMTILELEPLYIDKKFRRKVLKRIKDEEIRFFWFEEFSKLDNRQKFDHLMSLLDRLSTVSLDRRCRHTLGQNKSQIDFTDFMDTGKFLIVDLDMSKLGEDNARLLGTLIISKIFQASMGRTNKDMKFRLFVDEAQNFMTQSYSKILSQSRKFGIVQYLFTQYLDQLTEEVLSAVIGNVNTLIAMRCGINDAGLLAPYFARNQEKEELNKTIEDLLNLDAYHALCKTTVNKNSVPAFKMKTPPMLRGGEVDDEQQHYIQIKLNGYAHDRFTIENMIKARRFKFGDNGDSNSDESTEQQSGYDGEEEDVGFQETVHLDMEFDIDAEDNGGFHSSESIKNNWDDKLEHQKQGWTEQNKSQG